MSENNSNPESLLRNWLIKFVEHKDVLKKEIQEKKEFERGVLFVHKNRKHYYMILPFMKGIEEILEDKRKLKAEEDVDGFTVVCFNSEHNLKLLIANWKRFIGFPELNFIFVNPFSKSEKKWIVNPNFHQRICDNESLETGIQSLFNTVDKVEAEQIEKIFGS